MTFRTAQTIIPRQDGQYVNGHWADGADGTPYTIQATVQPATKTDYDQMRAEQSGRVLGKMVRIYTDASLVVAGADDSNGDSLIWMGDRFLVVDVAPWRTLATLKHYRYLAVKVTAL